MPKDRLHLDYETYSEVSLPKVGVSRYSRHASTEVLMAAWSLNDVPQPQWRAAEGEPMPRMLKSALVSPDVDKWAWNAPFEHRISANVLKLDIKVEQWFDTMVLAMTCSLPGKLEKAGPIVDLEDDKLKMGKGKRLMKKFSEPRKPSKGNPSTRWLWSDDVPDWEEYLDYNRGDETAERAIYHRLKAYMPPDHEWELWHLDQIINEEGLPINMRMVRNAITIYETLKREKLLQMNEITGLDNSNSGPQLLPWLQENGYPFNDLKAGHIDRAIEREAKDNDYEGNDYLTVLRLRSEVSRTSPKKFHALQRATDSDDRLRYAFQFAGAARTWRWAGRIYQPQNLPRPTEQLEKRIADHAKAVETLDPESIALIYSMPFDLLASVIRPVVQTPEGETFIDVDLNAIENRVLGWLADCPKILEVFLKNLDPYIAFAVYMYGIPYENLWEQYKNGDSSRRTIAKPGVLGCFGSDTPVLTDKGWKRIVDVKAGDRVHDGERFVCHDGVIYRGRREVLCRSGVYVTPDHKFLVENEWFQTCQLDDRQLWQKARDTANGLLARSSGPAEARGKFTSARVDVGSKGKSLEAIWFSKKQLAAIPALKRIAEAQSVNGLERSFTTFSQIVSTLRGQGAKTLRTLRLNTTAVGEFVCSSVAPINGWITSWNSARTERWSVIGETTMAITSPETCDSQLDPNKTQTSETWDILNAGPNSRFVVLTEDGPVVAHNCGYMLGAGDVHYNRATGEKEGTGLLGYAWNMGVKQFTKEESALSVETFRREFREVKEYWYAIEKACKQCIRRNEEVEFGVLSFDRKGPFMRMNLPSGRSLHYVRPRIEDTKMPWGEMKASITYEGLNDKKQWARQSTHPGKLTENADQAIARDILAHGLILAHKEGIRIPLHVHDQIVGRVSVTEAEEKLQILKECMSVVPKWAKGLPLGVAGHTTPIFIKD